MSAPCCPRMTTERPILYSFRRCPYAMRARLALIISETAVELREIKLSAKPDALLAASPKASVPVLVLPDGRVVDESLDIMRWALARHDPHDWLAGDDAALIAVNDGPFKHHLDRTKYPDRYASDRNASDRTASDPAAHRAAALALLAVLEQRLAINAQLCGPQPTLADYALMPFIRQFAAIDPGWFAAQPLPNTQRWLAGHLASPLFAAAMLRYPVWQPQPGL